MTCRSGLNQFCVLIQSLSTAVGTGDSGAGRPPTHDAARHGGEAVGSQRDTVDHPSHLLSEFVDGRDHFNATPAGLVYKEAPSTLYAADGTKVREW